MFSKIKAYLDEPCQKERMSEMINGFKTNFALIIDKIRELNPDAPLIVTDYFNPFYAIDVLLPEKIFQPYLDTFNEYITSHEYNGEKYSIATIRELGESVGLTNFNLIFKNLDVHPSVKGHALIAMRVWAAYSGDTFDNATETEPKSSTDAPETLPSTGADTSVNEKSKGCARFSPVALAAMLSLSLMLIINKEVKL